MTGHPHSFLRTLKGKVLSPPPIWFMRQAGRYLPEYRAVREEAGSFLDLCYNPTLACEVTMQPIRRYDLDAAILFADILLIPDALGLNVWFATGEGPRIEPTFSEDMVAGLKPENIHDHLSPVYETVSRIRSELAPEKALIGFAGAPWTVATYMMAGRGSKDPAALRRMAYDQPQAFQEMMGILTSTTAAYLIRQVQAGADAVQIFDSWANGLPEPFFRQFCLEPVKRIAEMVKAVVDVPVIAFPRACGPLYEEVAKEEIFDGVSIDTGLPWSWAATHLSPHGAVQGGLDPLLVVKGGPAMFEAAGKLIDAFKGKPFIFNLGHGFVPETPPEHVAELVHFIRGQQI